jgi:hypothetical protein
MAFSARVGRVVLGAGVAVVLCIFAVQLGTPGLPVALTARWTNDYQHLLNREATVLPAVDVGEADKPGGVEMENAAILASAKEEQDAYVKAQDAEALAQAKDTVRMAAETNAKFGGTFSHGVGSNTWAGTPYAKYDDKDVRATESLKMMADATQGKDGDREARMQILAMTAARVRADQRAAAEAASKKAQESARKAKRACNGNPQCEAVLNQVLHIYQRPPVGK